MTELSRHSSLKDRRCQSNGRLISLLRRTRNQFLYYINKVIMTPSLDLKSEDSLDDPFTFKVFSLLSDHLQPDTTSTQQSTAKALLDLLPDGKPESSDIWSFGETCIDLAEQIPYHHPSQLKLAALLDCMGKSTKLKSSSGGKVSTPYSIHRVRCTT